MKTVIIAISLSIVGIVLIAVFIYFGYNGIHSREITENEKQLLLNLDSLHKYTNKELYPESCEEYLAKLNLDGSLELEYKYDSDKDSLSDFLFMSSNAEINRTVKDARESFMMTIGAYQLGTKFVKERNIQEIPNFIELGDQCYFGMVMQDSLELGNVIVIRQNKTIHSLIILGLYFKDINILEHIFTPILNTSKKFKNKK